MKGLLNVLKKICKVKSNGEKNSHHIQKHDVEDLVFEPNFGERYYYVDYRIAFSEFYVNFTYNREWRIDDSMIRQGKCFKTEEMCQKKCDELNNAINNVK